MNPCAHPPTATITLWSVLLVSPPEPASQWIGLNPVPGMIISMSVCFSMSLSRWAILDRNHNIIVLRQHIL